MAVSPDVSHPQLILEMNVGISSIQGLEYWGWVGYKIFVEGVISIMLYQVY